MANDSFLHPLAHDLRRSLRAVILQAQMLERKPEQLAQRVAAILDAARQQDDLIRAAVEYDDACRQGIQRDKLAPLRTVVQTACLKTDAWRQAQQGILHFDAAAVPLDPAPLGLAAALERVLHNAFLYHAPSQPPVVSIDVASNENQWIIEIRDEGIGIAPEYRESVFTPFRRLHAAADYPGHGLGLATARALLSSLGGTVTLQAALHGPGSIARLAWPRV